MKYYNEEQPTAFYLFLALLFKEEVDLLLYRYVFYKIKVKVGIQLYHIDRNRSKPNGCTKVKNSNWGTMYITHMGVICTYINIQITE